MNQNLEEALQMLKIQFPKVSKLELGLPVVITTITSLQPPSPPTPIQTFTSGQILFVTEDTAVTEV